MPTVVRPLFRPEVLRQGVAGYRFSVKEIEARKKLAAWERLIEVYPTDRIKEDKYRSEFLTDVFVKILGYATALDDPDNPTLEKEQFVEQGQKEADGALGDMRVEHLKYVAAIEMKGPRDPLVRPFNGRRLSAVEQAYQYAINLHCDWIIVSNMKEIRLYHKGHDQFTYEVFQLSELVRDDGKFAKFLFLLGAQRVVPFSGKSHLDTLLDESLKQTEAIGEEFYEKYSRLRHDLFFKLKAENSNTPALAILKATQKLLDRVVFCAFCKDRNLLPKDVLQESFGSSSKYAKSALWSNLTALFRAIDDGSHELGIPRYNGGLFAFDTTLDRLSVSNQTCELLIPLVDYDFRPVSVASEGVAEASSGRVVDVEILGHIFERSITDLEGLAARLEGLPDGDITEELTVDKRRQDGAFYTKIQITRYIVDQTITATLRDYFENFRLETRSQAIAGQKKLFDDPRSFTPGELDAVEKEILRKFWNKYFNYVRGLRVLDPACGSGAFLLAAMDRLIVEYHDCASRLEALGETVPPEEFEVEILKNNLFGVDVNEEAVDICRLSLWIRTAQPNKVLTSLDGTIRVGNSVVNESDLDDRSLDWTSAFPVILGEGGFDIVVGNPPYVRQKKIKKFSRHFGEHYQTFAGNADLYVYFFERGISLLKPDGRLGFVVSNKWLRAPYGEPLRRFLAEKTWVELVVDFGHAKEIFPDADVFPSVVICRKVGLMQASENVLACTIPRELLRLNDLKGQIEVEGCNVPRTRFSGAKWSLERPEIYSLLQKIETSGLPLIQSCGCEPLSGIKTGRNEAYLVEASDRDRLIKDDPNCASILSRCVRGEDMSPWATQWSGLWMIKLESSQNRPWPWSTQASVKAEKTFERAYPSVYAHMLRWKKKLKARSDQGDYWWELRSCAYWEKFNQPKVILPEMTWMPSTSLDVTGLTMNNTAHIIPVDDSWLVAVLNSAVIWWYAWRTAQHGKDEVLRFSKEFVSEVPVPDPGDAIRKRAKRVIDELSKYSSHINSVKSSVAEWLMSELAVRPDSGFVAKLPACTTDEFVGHVRKRRGKRRLTVAELSAIRKTHSETVAPLGPMPGKIKGLEIELSKMVAESFRLSTADVSLMAATAPPRMPVL